MDSSQKTKFTLLFLAFGFVSFGIGTWFGGLWLGGMSESTMLLANSEYHDEIFLCGIDGDVECFKEEFGKFISFNSTHASMLKEQDITGFFTEELQARIEKNQELRDQLR